MLSLRDVVRNASYARGHFLKNNQKRIINEKQEMRWGESGGGKGEVAAAVGVDSKGGRGGS